MRQLLWLVEFALIVCGWSVIPVPVPAAGRTAVQAAQSDQSLKVVSASRGRRFERLQTKLEAPDGDQVVLLVAVEGISGDDWVAGDPYVVVGSDKYRAKSLTTYISSEPGHRDAVFIVPAKTVRFTLQLLKPGIPFTVSGPVVDLLGR